MFKNKSLCFQISFWCILITVTAILIVNYVIYVVNQSFLVENFSVAKFSEMNIINQQIQESNTQIIEVIENIKSSSELKGLLTLPVKNESEKYVNIFKMNKIISALSKNNNFYDISILIHGKNNEVYQTDSNLNHFVNSNLKKQNNIILKNVNKYHYNFFKISNNLSDHILVISNAIIDPINKTHYGNIYVTISPKMLYQYYQPFNIYYSQYFLSDNSGLLISNNSTDDKLKKIANIDILKTQNTVDTDVFEINNINNSEFIIISKYIPFFDCYLINLTDTNMAFYDSNLIFKVIFLSSFIIIILTSIIIFFISKSITNPINKLISLMKKSETTGFKEKINISGSLELQTLGNEYNNMTEKLENYITSLITEQTKRRKAELSALQMQIQPHFLYNTLSSIKYLVWKGDSNKQVDETINSLIILLQNTISDVDEKITIEQEIQNINHYISIQKSRYGNNINFHYTINPDGKYLKIPKLILQPFIENAFFHAFKENQYGNITLYIRIKGSNLICELFDNGVGMSEKKINDIFNNKKHHESFSGIGIKNVDERIKILYGDNYGINIKSALEYGTCVTIKLPINSL